MVFSLSIDFNKEGSLSSLISPLIKHYQSTILGFSKPLTSTTFTLHRVLGRDWLSTRFAVAGATFMNEFAQYAMQALPLKRHTRQRVTEFDFTQQHRRLHNLYEFIPQGDVCIKDHNNPFHTLNKQKKNMRKMLMNVNDIILS